MTTEQGPVTLADHVKDHEQLGSYRVRFGMQSEPEGYAVMNNGEGHCYFVRDDGMESAIHWNKWAVLKWAKQDVSERAALLVRPPTLHRAGETEWQS